MRTINKMSFCSQFKALLKKNFLLWKRNLCSSLCEIIFPILLLVIYMSFRFTMKEETMDPKSYIDDCSYGHYFDKDTKTGGSSSSDWMGLCKSDPFSSCIKFNMPVFGIVADDNDHFTKLEDLLVGPNGGNFIS